MEIEHPEEFNLDLLESCFSWKYLDLYKLLDLITTKDLYFTRFDHFEDGLEGLTGKAVGLMALTQGRPLTIEIVNKTFDENTRRRLVEEDKNRRQELEDIVNVSQKTQFANCWFLDDRESLSMWKIYSKKEGIALKFNAKQLVKTVIASAESFTNSDFKILYYGKVDYKNIWPFDPNERFDGKFNGLKKDRSYSNEGEFRFVAVVPPERAGIHHNFKLPIGELKDFELEIITNPFMETWQFDSLKNLLKNYGLDDKLTASKMKIKIKKYCG